MTYGLEPSAQIHPEDVQFGLTGIGFTAKTPSGDIPVQIRMAGQFNLFNALGAIGVGLALGVDAKTIINALADVTVHGRFEIVPGSKDFGIVVDYAHTPDGLENVLKAAKNLNPNRLIAIFGCGGDRDRTKRPIMGDIASRYADFTIITSDNPRTESPEGIIDEIEKGVRAGSLYEKITDRREAIRRSISMAKPGDFLVIAGKGHETYQIFADRTIHFDDGEVAAEALEDKKNGRL